MKIGYPTINLSIGCRGDRTFRLKSYSEARLVATVDSNLSCLSEMLRFNAAHGIRFFRITSDLVPFASHPICTFDWLTHFAGVFDEIGGYIRRNEMRISMHPDQFTLINSPDEDIFSRSVKDLEYHAQVLDALCLDDTARVQIHVGGVYGDKRAAIERFARRFDVLPELVRRRLVVENDDRLYSLKDCLEAHLMTGVPVLFDVFHHRMNGEGESVAEAFAMFHGTWREEDGLPMVDYSAQREGERRGKHVDTIERDGFSRFLQETRPYDFDIMLEIKDKERSALRAVELARGDPRFRG